MENLVLICYLPHGSLMGWSREGPKSPPKNTPAKNDHQILKIRQNVANRCPKRPPLAPPGEGCPAHFFEGFWHLGPKWCPRGLQGEPRGAQSHPKYKLLVIFCRFSVDFDVIFVTFGCSRECPSHKMNIKIWAAFSLRLRSARVPK